MIFSGDFFLEGNGPVWMHAVVLYSLFFILLSVFMIALNFVWNCMSWNKNEDPNGNTNGNGNGNINENSRIVDKSPIFGNFRNINQIEKPNYTPEFERLIVPTKNDNNNSPSRKKYFFSPSIDPI